MTIILPLGNVTRILPSYKFKRLKYGGMTKGGLKLI